MSRGRWLALVVLVILATQAPAQNKKPGQSKISKASAAKLDPQTAATLKAQFGKLDTSGDGHIDPVEAARVLRGLQAKPAFAPAIDLSGKPPAKPDPRLPDVQLFQTFDTNGDTLITLAEMENVLGKATAQQKQQQQKLQQQLQQKLEQLQRQDRQAQQKKRAADRKKAQNNRNRRARDRKR